MKKCAFCTNGAKYNVETKQGQKFIMCQKCLTRLRREYEVKTAEKL